MAFIGLLLGEQLDFPGEELQRLSPVDGSSLRPWTEVAPGVLDPLIAQLKTLNLSAEANLKARSAALLQLASDLERDAASLASQHVSHHE